MVEGLNNGTADKKAPRIFTLSNGVQLRLRAVPSFAIVAIQRQLKEPHPPIVIDPERQREFENPNDPTYIREKQEYDMALTEATTTAYLANGVQIFGQVPDDVLPEESDDWSWAYKQAGIQIPDSGIGRRVAWLKFHVVPDEDLADLIGAIAVSSGLVTEELVQAAAQSFRDNDIRDTNTEGENVTEIRPRDTTTSNPGSSDGV